LSKDKNCLSPIADTCVIWTGNDMPFFGIVKGEAYSYSIVRLAAALQAFVSEEVSLSCLYTGTCDNCSPKVRIPAAVQVIIDKLCILNTSDISNVGNLACLGISSLSPEATKLLNRPIQYVVQPTSTGASVTFDYMEALKNLPSGHEIGSISTKVTGTVVRGSSIIADSDKEYLSTNVKSERFPLYAVSEINILTPSGNVKLYKTNVITGTEPKDYSGVLDIYDFTEKDTQVFTQTQVNELISAELCGLKSEVDQYKNLDVASNECITFSSSDIKDVVSGLVAAVADICDRLTKLETVRTTVCDPCGTTQTEKTPEEAIEEVALKNCSQDEEIELLKQAIETLKEQLSVCC
jgi:hypothetical protein